MTSDPGRLDPMPPKREKSRASAIIARDVPWPRPARRVQKTWTVRFIIQIAERVHQLLQLVTPSALCVPIPVTSSAERVKRFPPNREMRRF